MWNFFDRVDKNCKCRICGTKISFCGNTSNMLSHITSMHPEKLKSGSSTQPKIERFTVPRARQDCLNRELSILLATKCLPLSLAESPPFRRFMSKCAPGYEVPCAKTIKANYIKPMNEQLRQKIKEEGENKKFGLTCDLWSNVNQESFLGLTCHYIADDIKRNVTLECVSFIGSHDNVNIREMVMYKHLNSICFIFKLSNI